MKNYLKFIVAVFGITIATFVSINATAKKGAVENVKCLGSGHCGYTPSCEEIIGTPSS